MPMGRLGGRCSVLVRGGWCCCAAVVAVTTAVAGLRKYLGQRNSRVRGEAKWNGMVVYRMCRGDVRGRKDMNRSKPAARAPCGANVCGMKAARCRQLCAEDGIRDAGGVATKGEESCRRRRRRRRRCKRKRKRKRKKRVNVEWDGCYGVHKSTVAVLDAVLDGVCRVLCVECCSWLARWFGDEC
ncbi:hypothetical protein GQ42DRAFT_57500 [Ramicandelaber brevisporus]|nr:hypothetical protein GQ42DRAFT_57500 [Ramicandelaber brevisporus]